MGEKERTPGWAKNPIIPTIMVVTHDLRLLKWLDLGLKLELACDVLGFTHPKSAEESAKHLQPDLLILDHQTLSRHQPGSLLPGIQGLEPVPTILMNAAAVSLHELQNTSTIALTTLWHIEELYAAVHELLGSSRDPQG
jgi:DNA-binding response OmpR family regulator